MHPLLSAKVCDFLVDKAWNLPQLLRDKCPELVNEILQVAIPQFPEVDQVVWCKSDSGELVFTDAFLFICPKRQPLAWCKLIWNKQIPPSKSFLFLEDDAWQGPN